MKAIVSISAIAAIAGAANAQQSFELGNGSLDEGFQVTDNSAPFFMNAQGNDPSDGQPDQFSEFYVMRFDLTGYTGADVASAEIDLLHSEPSFASSGGVSHTYSTDDSTDLSSLSFDGNTIGGLGSQLSPAANVANFDFIAGNDGVTDTFSLSDSGGFFSDIEGQGTVTLVLQATDISTTATYTGIDNFDGGPVLRITVVPGPGAATLAGIAGLVGLRRRRA